MSVASITDIGPREQNQDHARCRLLDDGSWLIAVADGVGGHPRGRAAARHAIRTLPKRISGADELFLAFRAAHSAVVKLAPKHLRKSMRDIHLCPATTLSVAAWTPESGLAVGIAGDTRVVALWRDAAGWHGRPVGRLHRSAGEFGYLIRCLGAPRQWPPMGTGRDPMDVLTDDDIAAPANLSEFVVVVASDGVWEPIASKAKRPAADAIAAVLDLDDSDAHTIASQIMNAAREAGLHDNATVSIACITNGAPGADAGSTERQVRLRAQ